ncbi:hypothetical protein AZE42_09970 [Rhizopogon vesiculosus]|uniref:Uncharacterized protein n=1 Tax=Rhizopogon vesiculosus TaxID=180088 RepID=A0A1J8QYY5_9AGAM|nr:hypothetical protein AZE42_09970 [Rhizopogon vesiculosus]
MGQPKPLWSRQQLLELSIPFNQALFPHGFPLPNYPTVTDTNALSSHHFQLSNEPSTVDYTPMYELLHPAAATHTLVETHLSDTFPPPASFPTFDFDAQLLSTMWSDLGNHNYWLLSGTSISTSGIEDTTSLNLNSAASEAEAEEEPNQVATGDTAPTDAQPELHHDLVWRSNSSDKAAWDDSDTKTKLKSCLSKSWLGQVLTITRFVFVGGLWEITTSFLTALKLEGKTYDDMLKQPLTFKKGDKDIIIEWKTIRPSLMKQFENSNSELRKVVKGAMSTHTGFCNNDEGDRKQVIIHFIELFNSDDLDQVRSTVSELVGHQVFKELLWASLFIPIKGFDKETHIGRTADFFPTEVCASEGYLSQAVLYHTMVLVFREGATAREKSIYTKHKTIRAVILAAIGPMYENPHLFPQFTEAVISLPYIKSALYPSAA